MKKEKLRGIILGATISAAILIPKSNVYAAEVKSKGTVQNVSSTLRIRKSASTSSEIIGSLKNNETVDIKGKTGNWYSIQHGNVSGYVYDEYIKVTTEQSGSSSSSSQNSSTSSTGYVTNVSTSLRLRKSASTSSNIIDYLREGQSLKIEGSEGNWYKVYVNGKTGYVSKDYVKVSAGSSSSNSSNSSSNSNQNSTSSGTTESYEAKDAVLQNVSSSLRIRSSASTSSSVLGYIYPGNTFKVIGESGSWYHVEVGGKKGYASKEYVKIGAQSSTNNNSSNNTNSGSGSSEQVSATYEKVINLMKQQIGSPYVYGGAGEMLTTSLLDRLKAEFPSFAATGKYANAEKEVGKGYRAFDCSGLMYWAFGQAGVSLGRTTYSQINNGSEVSPVTVSNLKPGDLLFYSNLGHVGMYIGNGQWIESPNHNACVRITNVPWNSIGRARRVL